MRSTASYTCQRCMFALRSSQRPSSSSISSQQRILSSLNKRSISSKPSNGSTATTVKNARQVLRRDIGRRSASTIGTQGETVRDGPPEARTSPGLASTPDPATSGRPLLLPNNLFHPFSSSPSPEIRRRAAFMKQNAYCPHPDHRQTRISSNPDDPEAQKAVRGTLPPAHVSFECPDCGIPVSCSEEHWADDYESH